MKKISCFILLFFIGSTPTQAKWAFYEDAVIKKSRTIELFIKEDGNIEQITKIQFEILKEAGRNVAANYTLQYNESSEKIKILEAKTVFKNKAYHLDKNLIEDKPLASPPGGFDQKRQILLAFPKAEVGAKVFLTYSIITTEVPLPKFFSAVFDFGSNEYLEKSHIKIQSQIPLHALVNDPEKSLKIIKNSSDNFNNIEIILTKPIYKQVIDEPDFNIVNAKHLTWVSLSSLTKWEDLAARFSEYYKKVFTQKLPKDFITIATTAKKKTDDLEQIINTVTSLLNDKIQYMGDWRTIKGQLVARNLNEIAQTQLGDCKDFSAATAAILTNIGFKAQIALVRRGVGNFYPETLPDISAFNHALVKVTNKNGKVYWIDPTNFQSMAGGIFPDIANKKALILDNREPDYKLIPNISYDHAQRTSKQQIEIINDNKISDTGNIILKNEEAYGMTGVELNIPEETIKDYLFNELSGSRLEEKDKKRLKLPNLKSRIVKDLSFSYSFEQKNKLFKTNLGDALKLNYHSLFNFFDIAQDHVSDILVSKPCTITKQIIIKNIKVQNIKILNKEIKSPWLYVSRKCSVNKKDLQIDETIIIYKNLIPNEELKTPGFLALKDDLEKNFKDIAVVFSKQK